MDPLDAQAPSRGLRRETFSGQIWSGLADQADQVWATLTRPTPGLVRWAPGFRSGLGCLIRLDQA